MEHTAGFIFTALPLRRDLRSISKAHQLKPVTSTVPRSIIKAQITETADRTSWLSAVGDLFFGKDNVCLPQLDPKQEERRADIERGRRKYKWRHNACADASMIDGLPLPNELPRLGWLESLLFIILGAIKNNRLAAKNFKDSGIKSEVKQRAALSVARDAKHLIGRIASGEADQKDIEKAMHSVGTALNELSPTGTGSCFDEYRQLYKTFEMDVVCEEDQFLTDEIFAWYRVAGASCMRLTKITDFTTKFPELTDEIFRSIRHFENDSLQAAANSDRLYYVEYPEFNSMPDTKPGRYVYSPLALFAVPLEKKSIRQSLLPIAIHCKPGFPMFTPKSDKLAWIAAKSTVQTMDAVTQAVVYHLSRCHLLIEVFNCATHRALAENHPLYKLLMVHFTGTALMNFAATKTLIGDGNDIDKITSAPMSDLRELAAKSINCPDKFCFNDWMVDRELENRGVMSDKLVFPYRDDALQIWDAIMKWVRSYIGAYYISDSDVAGDRELEQWCFEVSGRTVGNLPGFGDANSGRITTVETLVRTVTMIIFTASAQHSAINFPQSTVMQYAPAMALGGYTPPLDCERPYKHMDDMVTKVMPPLQAAAKQMFVAEVLGTLHYTRLGDYGSQLKFAPREVQEALKDFNADLTKIGAKVCARNQKERKLRLPVYDYMHPSKIPQSINI